MSIAFTILLHIQHTLLDAVEVIKNCSRESLILQLSGTHVGHFVGGFK